MPFSVCIYWELNWTKSSNKQQQLCSVAALDELNCTNFNVSFISREHAMWVLLTPVVSSKHFQGCSKWSGVCLSLLVCVSHNQCMPYQTADLSMLYLTHPSLNFSSCPALCLVLFSKHDTPLCSWRKTDIEVCVLINNMWVIMIFILCSAWLYEGRQQDGPDGSLLFIWKKIYQVVEKKGVPLDGRGDGTQCSCSTHRAHKHTKKANSSRLLPWAGSFLVSTPSTTTTHHRHDDTLEISSVPPSLSPILMPLIVPLNLQASPQWTFTSDLSKWNTTHVP